MNKIEKLKKRRQVLQDEINKIDDDIMKIAVELEKYSAQICKCGFSTWRIFSNFNLLKLRAFEPRNIVIMCTNCKKEIHLDIQTDY